LYLHRTMDVHRVPMIVRWPGVVGPGSVCQELVHQADWIPPVKPQQEGELYHLGDDRLESRNLAGENPQRVQSMKQTFEEIIVRGRSTLGAKRSLPGTVPGFSRIQS